VKKRRISTLSTTRRKFENYDDSNILLTSLPYSYKFLQNKELLNLKNLFPSITNKIQRYTIRLFLQYALHVSGGSSAHHQPLLLPFAVVEELVLQSQLLHDSER
jgi:hypothetical protein